MDYRGAPNSALMGIPAGTAGTRRTLQLMNIFILNGKVSPFIHKEAQRIASYFPSRDWIGICKALQQYVKDNVRYVPDVLGVETLQQAEYTLAMRAGDCDDQSILLASLYETIGQPTQLVAIGFKHNQYSHVFVEVQPGAAGPWYGAETIIDKPFGWTPPGVVSTLKLRNTA